MIVFSYFIFEEETNERFTEVPSVRKDEPFHLQHLRQFSTTGDDLRSTRG